MLNEILLLICLFFIICYKSKSQLPKNLPPGPWRLPGIGNLFQLAIHKKNNPFETFHEINKKYGPITFIQLGDIYQILIEDYDIIKEVLTDELWVDRYYSKWMAHRSFGKNLGVLMISGPNWKEMRRFSVRTLRDFGFGKQKSMELELNEELVEFRGRIESEVGECGVICMKQLFTVSVLNVLWSMIAGRRFCHDDEKLHELLEIIENEVKTNPIGELSSPLYLYSAFPFLESIIPLFSSKESKIKEAQSRLHGFFQKTLEERRAEGLYVKEQRDYIDVFLKQIDAHKDESPETNYYTDQQFIVVTMDLFMAGSETTSNTIEFAIFYLMKNPEVQLKVQAEIDAVVGSSRLPCISDKAKMPYTEAAILEVQRHGSVVPIDIRSPIKETTLRGYTIPPKCSAVINLHAMHMSEKIWDDPLAFNPARFLSDDMQVINAEKILPFGAGKRVCLGEQLAKASVFTYITTMLQKFTFEESPSHPLPSNEADLGFTLSPQLYHALVRPRVNH